jgi:GMP synthase-like glutamine amidotransferase
MRFALIKADYVNDELLAEHGDLPDMFGRLFAGVTLDVYEARHHRLPDPTRYDACLVTGSRYSVNDDSAWIRELLAFLRDTVAGARSSVVGLCFGHQALAKALGGRVGDGPCAWNMGVWPVGEVRGLPAPAALHALFNHREQVVVPPRGAQVLAGTDRCPVQMFAVGDRALGLQFHPEYTLAYQEALMGVARGMPADVRRDADQRNRALARNDEIARDWVLALAARGHREPVHAAGAGR